MRTLTFVKEGTVGRTKYKPGDTATLPEAFVRVLVRRGLAVDGSLPAPVAVPPADPVTDQQEERKPSLSKRALKKLLRRKA